MPRVVVTEFMHPPSLEELESHFDVLSDSSLADDRTRLLHLLDDTEALVVRNRTEVDSELLAAAPLLRVVARLGVGLDNIDLAACDGRSIPVVPATGANSTAVAEYVIGAMLVLRRGVFTRSGETASGRWPRDQMRGREVAGLRLGLIGYGGIAREVASRARALGMEISAHDPFLDAADPVWHGATRLSLSDLISTADVISLHVPLNDDTRHVIDEVAIGQMKPNAVVINTARGGVVDEGALTRALRAGRIAGAALDVFAAEPLDAASGAEFEDVPNLILTPHIAGITEESEARIGEITVSTLMSHLRPDR